MMKLLEKLKKHIKKSVDDGIKVNNFDEMKEEIIEHIANLKNQGINVKIHENQIDSLINIIFDKKDAKESAKPVPNKLKDFIKKTNIL